MCIKIMARNDHQRALKQIKKLFAEGLVVLFAYFICGIALPVLWTIATEAIYGVRESDIFSRTFETHFKTAFLK